MFLVYSERLASSILSELKPIFQPLWRSLWYIKSILDPGISANSRILRSSVRGLVKLGHHSLVSDSSIAGSVSIGFNSKILESSLVGTINIGNFTTINGPSTIVYSEINSISIGSFTSIAPNCSIYEVNHCSTRLTTYNIDKNLFSTFFSGVPSHSDSQSKGPVYIGSDVWIGAQTVILSGSIIGDGAIIGANSVVTGKIPPYSIAVGSPAKVISYRYDLNIIERLLAIKWWEWDLDKLISNRSIFVPDLSLKVLDMIS